MSALPLPQPDLASAVFFAALDYGDLDVQRCTACGTAHLAALTCDACGHAGFRAEPAGGYGVVHSLTRVHIAHHPAFQDHLPWCGGIVELDEGPRLFAPLLGERPFAIGDRVELQLLPVDGRQAAAFRHARTD